uniref:Structural protein n=1 Tax=Heterorhabditis bacteriophora TaxID=37862 RepID=A0A1I7WSR7_HETBA
MSDLLYYLDKACIFFEKAKNTLKWYSYENYLSSGNSQVIIGNHIFPVTVSSSEAKYETAERTDTVYDEPIDIVVEPPNNLTTAQITEYYEKDKLDKWNKNRLPAIYYPMWKMTKEGIPYKTNMEVTKNDRPEADDDFLGNVVKAEKFFQGSGRIILSGIFSITLAPLPLVSSFDLTTEAPLITLQPLATKVFEDIGHSSSKSTSFEGSWEEEPSNGAAVTITKLPKKTDGLSLLPLEITGLTDVAVLPRMHNDVQRLIQEVNVIKITGLSSATPGTLRLIAHQKIEDSREGNYIHIWPEVTTSKLEISTDDFKI